MPPLSRASKIPVVLLTAKAEETDRIVGLEIGADDYICKPFNPRELLARIKAVLRRTVDTANPGEREKPALYQFEGWQLDPVRRTLHNPEGALVELTAGEFDLLLAFADRPQHVLTRDHLLDLTRGRESSVFDRSIDVQVSRLRRKIEADPQVPVLIKTVRSGGYVFCADVLDDRNGSKLGSSRLMPFSGGVRRLRLWTRIAVMMVAALIIVQVLYAIVFVLMPARLMVVYSAHWLIEKSEEAAIAIFKADPAARNALAARFASG